MQENDAVVPQIAQGFLDVAHDLLIGVEPVDQGDVDGVLLEEGRLVLEEGVAGRLEVMGGARLCVGELARRSESLNAGSTAIFTSALIRWNACPRETPISR